MGALFEADAYAFHWLTVPYLTLAVGVSAIIVYLLFTRGDPVMRVSMLAIAVGGLVFVAAQGMAMSADDPEVATKLYRLAVTPISLVGPASLALTLAIVNRLPHHKRLLALSVVTATVTMVLAATTELVTRSVWVTPIGVYYERAGALGPIHVGSIVLWIGVGQLLSARGARAARASFRRAQRRRIVVAGLLVAVACADGILAQGVGYMPVAWIPLLPCVAVALHALVVGDLVRRRGRDYATAWEIAVVVALGALVFAAHAGAGGVRFVTVLAAVPLMAVAHVAVTSIRGRAARAARDTDDELSRALDVFAEQCAEVVAEDRLADATRAFLRDRLELADARIYVLTEEGMRPVGVGDEDERVAIPVDVRVKAWLAANRDPLLQDRLDSQRLGGLRAPIEDFMRRYEAEVVLPLVDRDALVGLVATGAREVERALSDSEVEALAQVREAVTRTLTYLQLYREAEQRVDVAREVEIAAAVQHARAEGETTVEAAGCEVTSFYLPAGQFGGDWWMHDELPDGRLLIVIGDVTGHGVPAALVTATVEGSCETAVTMLGAGFNVFDLLHLLNRSVLDVGRSRYLMSCFAAVIDREAKAVTFANAGHPFPYLCRRSSHGGARGQLRALVSKGMPLGVEREPLIAVARLELEPDDVLVFYTDALVESESDQGARYGERRLQRALRTLACRSGARPCDDIVDDARAHYGSRPIREDITLVCVRIGADAPRPG